MSLVKILSLPGSHASNAQGVEDAHQELEKENEEKHHEVEGAVVSEKGHNEKY